MKPNEIVRTEGTLPKVVLPTIDLYMDQVIQLFEQHYGKMKRNEDETILTKTMINNYAKGKLFHPVKNKKYTNEHLMLLSLIYEMKGLLSINDIKETLRPLNESDEAFSLEDFYDAYQAQKEQNLQAFETQAETLLANVEVTETSEIQQSLAIASAVHMSHLYQRLAERLIDESK
ncbi:MULTISPECIES: DUF1836 domain-containing protein [unclassified Exiguobacterium]|uniref:DUF1836 domain-containing protein n=1 Tax=unclassified Exiguobacterium TaxID=2644629 RepID=UPI00103E163D|nr:MULTISPECIES: DUF1836 domain-containing protein [unclassified Exiguobacterium]TCI53604.1 DUF1836 domain-containing protein [Exiguobacterium sp. SH5S13]TCI66429.1 DUF1836 domain-containing protein [Exiguobacterium sp. SH3S1]